MREPLAKPRPLWQDLADRQRQEQAEEEEEARRIHKRMVKEGSSDSTARRLRQPLAVEKRAITRMVDEFEEMFPEAPPEETGEDPDHGF